MEFFHAGPFLLGRILYSPWPEQEREAGGSSFQGLESIVFFRYWPFFR